MLIDSLEGLTYRTKVNCCCDECAAEFLQQVVSAKKILARGPGHHLCPSCSAKKSAKLKPQCSPDYWASPEVKKAHGKRMKTSEAYQASLQGRVSKTTGAGNGMHGKKHTPETLQAMSLARTGRKQSQATVEKRRATMLQRSLDKPKKTSLNVLVKSYLARVPQWFKRVYERDGSKCRECGGKGKLDAHHIIPISSLMKIITTENPNATHAELFELAIKDPRILDEGLTNGITLCRSCHKKAHHKWGSHHAECARNPHEGVLREP